MAADADPGHPEGEDQVDDDEDADLPDELLDAAMAGDDERGRHEAEDRARGADGELRRAQQQGAEGPGQQGDEVDAEEARRADRRLEQGAEDEQREHVERDVEEAGVQEPGGDDPPPVAVGDRRAVEARVVDQRCRRR